MSSSSRCANRRELLAAWGGLALPAWAQPAPSGLSELPDWVERRRSRMRFLGLLVYEIGLWSPAPVDAANWTDQPLALSLRYARSLKGGLIAERSLREMRRQGPIEATQAERWLQAMREAFPDVSDGDRLTGRHEPGEGARFWFNGQARALIDDPLFSRRFFGIWLAPESSEPQLREQLLGLRP